MGNRDKVANVATVKRSFRPERASYNHQSEVNLQLW